MKKRRHDTRSSLVGHLIDNAAKAHHSQQNFQHVPLSPRALSHDGTTKIKDGLVNPSHAQ